jgi:FkbM family methyltransferase
MVLEPPGLIEDTLIQNKSWEPYLEKVISMFLKENSIFLDIGAYIGFHSLSVAIERPDVTCISFEPHPQIYKQLLRNIEINHLKNVMIYNLGVGDCSKEIDFYMQTEQNYNRALSAIDYNTVIGECLKKTIKIVALDDFLKDDFKKKVSVVKIDTQGYEYQVLQGALKVIEKYQPIIIFEYHPNSNHNLDQILTLLPQYRVFKIQPWTGVIRSIEQSDPEGFLNDYVCIPRNRKIPSEIQTQEREQNTTPVETIFNTSVEPKKKKRQKKNYKRKKRFFASNKKVNRKNKQRRKRIRSFRKKKEGENIDLLYGNIKSIYAFSNCIG